MNPVLVDTSVWVDHFRRGNPQLAQLLQQDMVLMHPMVLGELACGTPPARARTLADLQRLRPARQASMREVLGLIEREQLFGLGCGLGPVHTNVGSRNCRPAPPKKGPPPGGGPHPTTLETRRGGGRWGGWGPPPGRRGTLWRGGPPAPRPHISVNRP
jgi:hypothetical protein